MTRKMQQTFDEDVVAFGADWVGALFISIENKSKSFDVDDAENRSKEFGWKLKIESSSV